MSRNNGGEKPVEILKYFETRSRSEEKTSFLPFVKSPVNEGTKSIFSKTRADFQNTVMAENEPNLDHLMMGIKKLNF